MQNYLEQNEKKTMQNKLTDSDSQDKAVVYSSQPMAWHCPGVNHLVEHFLKGFAYHDFQCIWHKYC